MISIQVNQSNEEMHKVFMDSDITRWKEEIEIINVEMVFYKNLLNAHLQDNTTSDKVNYEGLFQGITDVEHYNTVFQKSFLNFNNRIPGMAECLDLQCETHYLNEHAQLKEEIEKHFSVYKQFKKTLFTYLKMRYNY